eukprot:8538444-Prorocentrum_lima.AAC.1
MKKNLDTASTTATSSGDSAVAFCSGWDANTHKRDIIAQLEALVKEAGAEASVWCPRLRASFGLMRFSSMHEVDKFSKWLREKK